MYALTPVPFALIDMPSPQPFHTFSPWRKQETGTGRRVAGAKYPGPEIRFLSIPHPADPRGAFPAQSSVPGIRPSASIRCQLSGARYPGPETRHPYRIPIPGRKAGIPAHALKKHAHGVCIMGDRAKGGDRISSICISNLNKAVGTLWMHPVRGPKIQTWKGLRTLSCGDGKGR